MVQAVWMQQPCQQERRTCVACADLPEIAAFLLLFSVEGKIPPLLLCQRLPLRQRIPDDMLYPETVEKGFKRGCTDPGLVYRVLL